MLRWILTVALLGVAVAHADDAADLASAKAKYTTLIAGGGQYMHQNCQPSGTVAGYENLAVVSCTYSSLGATASVQLLDADADRLARWTLSACKEIQSANVGKCVKVVASHIWGESNAQFPVAGYVIEPASAIGGSGDDARCLLFRDGVTVATATVDTRAPKDGKCGPDAANAEPVTRVKLYGRIASTTREQYTAAGGTMDVGTASNRKLAWRDAIRAEYVKAWASDRNLLISAWAIAAKKDGMLK